MGRSLGVGGFQAAPAPAEVNQCLFSYLAPIGYAAGGGFPVPIPV